MLLFKIIWWKNAKATALVCYLLEVKPLDSHFFRENENLIVLYMLLDVGENILFRN